MDHLLPRSMPEAHRRFLTSAIGILGRDPRIMGIAAGGSFLTDSMDECSDLDLIIATESSDHGSIMSDGGAIARSLGPLLSAFTGEHVGDHRVLICLYDGEPPLHVDLKFVALADLATRVEDPFVLWERNHRLTRALEGGTAAYPAPNPQWIEDRFWVWIHYGATKIGRGEIFETLSFLSFLRMSVLGPLALLASGARPAGVRRFETQAPAYVSHLSATVASPDAVDCLRALRACADAYRLLRSKGLEIELRTPAENAAMRYVDYVEVLTRASRAAG